MPGWVKELRKDIVDEIQSKHDLLEATLQDVIKNSLDSCELKKTVESNVEAIGQQKSVLNIMRKKQCAMNDRLIKLESHSMRESLLISGIPEADVKEERESEDDVRTLVNTLLEDMKVENVDNIMIPRCHIIGARKYDANSRPRDIVVRFLYYPDRQRVMRAAKSLKGRGIYLEIIYRPK